MPIRLLLVSALAILLLAGERTAPGMRGRLGRAVPIRATPVPLDPANPANSRVGRLRFTEGWQIDADDPLFGGFSALAVEGRRFTLLSDLGGVARFSLRMDGRVSDIRFGDLTDGPDDGRLKEARDAESLARHPGGGWWVGFERANAIGRYDETFARLLSLARPAAMADWPNNAGAEAMTRLRDGRVLVVAEGGRGAEPGTRPALIFPDDPAVVGTPAIRLSVRPPAGFRVTDAATLPDGRVIALHRRFRLASLRFGWRDGGPRLTAGLDAAVAIYDPRGAEDGSVLAAEPVAILAPPLTVDNMEGIAVVPDAGRGTAIWLLSDDNLKGFERTLLMRFVLEE